MYKLELNNEEFFTLRALLESLAPSRNIYDREAIKTLQEKLTISHCNAIEEEEREAQAERYAQNLHSMPEGA